MRLFNKFLFDFRRERAFITLKNDLHLILVLSKNINNGDGDKPKNKYVILTTY